MDVDVPGGCPLCGWKLVITYYEFKSLRGTEGTTRCAFVCTNQRCRAEVSAEGQSAQLPIRERIIAASQSERARFLSSVGGLQFED